MTAPGKSNKNSKYNSVFLSYSRNDKKFVEKLVSKLKENGVEVWLDEEKLGLGEWFTNKIGEAIDKSDFFAVVLSQNALNSKYVEKEIEIALNIEINKGEVVVLPLLIEENIPLPAFLRGKNYVLFTSSENFEKSFQKLLTALEKEVPGDSDSDKFYPNKFIPDLKFFVGRTHLLEDLENQLSLTHRASIHDISGLGKTFTTYKFAGIHQNKYDKIFFVRANKEEMMQSLAEIGVLLNPFLKDEPDQSKQASGFKKWLEENDKWLVIYDNVDEPVKLHSFVPLNKEGDCIFTSNFALITSLGDEIKINKLDKDDAESLLFSRANDKPQSKIEFSDIKEQKAFENIVKEIDGLPVSLNTTGAFISGNFISFAEFEGKMKKTPDILLKNEDGFDRYQNKSALKAFSIAIDDISIKKDGDEFENSPGLARKLLFAASIIAPDNIPERFLRRILSEIAEIDFEAEENADLWLEIRRKLLAYDLLKYDKAAKTFKTHRLIQKVIQIKQSDDEKKTVCNAVSIALDKLFLYFTYETKNEGELFAPHAVVLIEIIEKVCFSSEEIANIYDKIGRYLRDTVKYQDSIGYFEKAITFYRNQSEKDNENLAVCLNELALVYDSQGRYDEAIEKLEEALRIDEKTIGKEHPSYATRLSNLANVYHLQGRYGEAIEKLEEALRIGEKTIGKEHPDYANRLNNLANVYKSQGRYDEAIELYKQALEIDEKTIGREHPNYAIRLNNLANVYHLQGRYDEALNLYKEVLEIGEKTTGKEHPYYAIYLSQLAQVYQSQGRYDEALNLYKEVLEIDEKAIGKEHPDYATHLGNLANVYQSQGRYDEAIELYKQALEIDEKTIGREHPNYAIRLSNLASIYENQGKYKEALDLYEEVLRINEKTLPENHPYTKQDIESEARCREKLGEK